MHPRNDPAYTMQVFGVILFPAILSLLYLIGWLGRWTDFLTLIPNSPPMVFNTALCFLLLSVNVLAFRHQRFQFLRQLWIIPLVIAFFSGVQYILDLQLGLDEFFTTSYLRSFRSHPGRMSPVTCVCLTALSIAWGARVNFPNDRRIWIWGGSLACITIAGALGLFHVFDYCFAYRESLSWGSYSKASLASALVFIYLAAVGLFEIRSQILHSGQSWRKRRTLIAVIAGLLLTLLSWHICNHQESTQVGQSLKLELENRYQQFYQAFQYRAEELQDTSTPKNFQQATNSNWSPPFASVEAFVQLKPKPSVIWDRSGLASDEDLKIFESEMNTYTSSFHFHPSLIYQRKRLMGFQFQEKLWIFSPQVVVNLFFPDDQFAYTLKNDREVLVTNTTGIIGVLNQWTVLLPLRLWDNQLTLEVTPTRATLERLENRQPMISLLTGLALTVFFALLAYLGPFGFKEPK